ncbi:MAG: hypothetical protein ACI8QC_002451 [Planctomycetota bacterium]|jgi:hypothetical protein
MSPQFVDMNADGHIDILTAIFDGSPHIAYGTPTGFEQPVRLKDAAGKRLIITSFWNYEDEEHQVSERAMLDPTGDSERCISALAFDWDADGDYDLLLGSYENGHLYRQMNEGTNAKPKFTGQNIPVMAGADPFAVPGKMTSPRLVDWDGDGDLDLIAGSFGDSYGDGVGGAVYLFLNVGSKGQPDFNSPDVLISPSPKGHKQPTRPDAGLYVDAVDYDKDGDLDLVVGAYSMWQADARELSAQEQDQLTELTRELAGLQEELNTRREALAKQVAAVTAGLDRKSDEYKQKAAPLNSAFRKDNKAPTNRQQLLRKQIDTLVPSAQRQTFVWLYERL